MHLPPNHHDFFPVKEGTWSKRTKKLFLNTGAFAWGLTQPQAAGRGVRVSGESKTIVSLCVQSAQVGENKLRSEGKTGE